MQGNDKTQRLRLTTSNLGQDLDSEVASCITGLRTRSDASTGPGDCSARSSVAASFSSAASMISSDAGTSKKDSSASRWGVRAKHGDQESLQRWQNLWFGERSMATATWFEDANARMFSDNRQPCQWDQFRPNEDPESWEFPDGRQPCQWDHFRTNEDPETWEIPDNMQPCHWDHFRETRFRSDEDPETWEFSDSWHPYQWNRFNTDEDPETWENPGNWQRCQWDQFKTNEELFGVTSTFRDDLSQYTTPLDLSTVPWELQRLADVIACEIANENSSGAGGHGSPGMGSDNETESPDEEELWAAVPREAPGSSMEGLPAPIPCQVQDDHSSGARSAGCRSSIGFFWFWDVATPGAQLAGKLCSELCLRLSLLDSRVRGGTGLFVTIVCFNMISCLMRLIFANAYFATGFVAIFLIAVTAYGSGWHPTTTPFVEDLPHAHTPSRAKAAQVQSSSRGSDSTKRSSGGLPCSMRVTGQTACWVDRPERFRRACRRLSAKQLPTETPGLRAPRLAVVPVADPCTGELCLLCVASALGEVFVFDLRSTGADPAVATALGELMKDPAHTIVLHADRRGVRALERKFGADVFAGNFWNTQVVDLVLRRHVHREGTIAQVSCLRELWKRYKGDPAKMEDALEEISLKNEHQLRLQLAAQAKAILLLASKLTHELVKAFGWQQDFTLRIAELSRLHAEEELDDDHDPALCLRRQPSQAFLQAVARAVRGMELQAVFDTGRKRYFMPGGNLRERLDSSCDKQGSA